MKPGGLKPGDLYEVKHKWLLPFKSEFWKDCNTVLFIGEEVINRDDGVKIVNYAFLAKGEKRIVDPTFLKFFGEANEERNG